MTGSKPASGELWLAHLILLQGPRRAVAVRVLPHLPDDGIVRIRIIEPGARFDGHEMDVAPMWLLAQIAEPA